MFDFTSLYHAVNASRIVERHGKQIFMALVGDSLLEVNTIHKNTFYVIYKQLFLELLAERFRNWSWIFWSI